jgi:F-type H+-transporting ATPase subunit epsilon
MRTFHLTVAKVGENVFSGEAISATLPGDEGVFQVLAGHEALVSELKPGALKVVAGDEQTHQFEIPRGGIVEVSNNQATVLL